MSKHFVCLLMLLFYIPYCNSNIFRGIYSNRAQTDSHLFCFCDQHKESQDSVNQLFDFLVLATFFNAHVIAEDVYCDDSKLYVDDCGELLAHVDSPSDLFNIPIDTIFGISQFCKMLCIDVKNIEFRHFKARARELKKAHLVSERIATEICSYDDGSILNTYYQGILKTYKEYASLAELLIKLVERFCDKKSKVLPKYNDQFKNELNRYADLIDNALISIFSNKYVNEHTFLTHKEAQEWAQDKVDLWSIKNKVKHFLNLYDSGLIEARIVHEIYNSKNKITFVYAGAAHLINIAAILEKLGFVKKIDETGSMNEDYSKRPIDLISFFVKTHGICLLQKIVESTNEVLDSVERYLPECKERAQWITFIKEKRDSMEFWESKYACLGSSAGSEKAQNSSICSLQPQKRSYWGPSLAIAAATAAGLIGYKALFKR